MDIPLVADFPAGPIIFGPKYTRRSDRNTHYSKNHQSSYHYTPQKIDGSDTSSGGPLPQNDPKRKRKRLANILLLSFSIGLILWLLVQLALLQFNSNVASDLKVERVCVSLSHKPGYMSLELINFDDHDHLSHHQLYLLPGNQWRIRGEVTAPSANIPGLSSFYKLISLQSSNSVSGRISKSINFEHDNDWFFRVPQSIPQIFPLLKAYTGNSDFWPADREMKVYDVYLSQSGFSVEQAPASAVKSCALYDSAVPAP